VVGLRLEGNLVTLLLCVLAVLSEAGSVFKLIHAARVVMKYELMLVLAAEMHRVCAEGSATAALRSDHETSAAHLAAGDVARLRILPLYSHHHQHRRASDEGRL